MLRYDVDISLVRWSDGAENDGSFSIRVDDCGTSKRTVPKDAKSLLYKSSPVQVRPPFSARVGNISIAEFGNPSDVGDMVKPLDELRRGGRGRGGSVEEKLALRTSVGEAGVVLSHAPCKTLVSTPSIVSDIATGLLTGPLTELLTGLTNGDIDFS